MTMSCQKVGQLLIDAMCEAWDIKSFQWFTIKATLKPNCQQFLYVMLMVRNTNLYIKVSGNDIINDMQSLYSP